MTISGKRPKKNVNHGMTEKLGVERERQERERGKRPKKNVNHGMTEKSGVERERQERERGKRPKKNVNHGMTEKSGVDPPPSPTTPAFYIQLFCNLRQVQHCGTTYRNKHVSYNTHVFLIKI